MGNFLGIFFNKIIEKNEFDKLCDEIQACSKRKDCDFNPIVCAESFVKGYVKNDRYKLLRLKAEGSQVEYSSFVMGLFSMISFPVSVFSLILNIFKDVMGNNCFLEVLVMIILIVLVLLILLAVREMIHYRNSNKWQQYVMVAIEEVEPFCR